MGVIGFTLVEWKVWIITVPNISTSRIYVSFLKLEPGISPCQRINTLVHTNNILRLNTCQNVSIMTRIIDVRRSVTPVSLMSDVLWHHGSWHSNVRIRISFPYVPPFLFYCPFVHHLYDYSYIYVVLINIIFLVRLTFFCLVFCRRNRSPPRIVRLYIIHVSYRHTGGRNFFILIENGKKKCWW